MTNQEILDKHLEVVNDRTVSLSDMYCAIISGHRRKVTLLNGEDHFPFLDKSHKIIFVCEETELYSEFADKYTIVDLGPFTNISKKRRDAVNYLRNLGAKQIVMTDDDVLPMKMISWNKANTALSHNTACTTEQVFRGIKYGFSQGFAGVCFNEQPFAAAHPTEDIFIKGNSTLGRMYGLNLEIIPEDVNFVDIKGITEDTELSCQMYEHGLQIKKLYGFVLYDFVKTESIVRADGEFGYLLPDMKVRLMHPDVLRLNINWKEYSDGDKTWKEPKGGLRIRLQKKSKFFEAAEDPRITYIRENCMDDENKLKTYLGEQLNLVGGQFLL